MRMLSRVILAAATAGLYVTAAQAQPVDTLSMDRLTSRSSFGLDLGYGVWDPPVGDLDAIGINIGGHFVTPTGFGAYGMIPLSFIDVGTLLVDDSELAIGNLELGGMYALPLTRSELVLRAGVALPTADDDGAGALQALASVPRYGDFALRYPDSTWLRLSASPMGRAGRLFWRADIGLDLAIDDDSGDALSPILRLNVGGGVDLGAAQLMAELVTNIADPESDTADETTSALTLGARFGTGPLRPGIGLVVPVGNDDVDDLDFAIAVSLAIAAR